MKFTVKFMRLFILLAALLCIFRSAADAESKYFSVKSTAQLKWPVVALAWRPDNSGFVTISSFGSIEYWSGDASNYKNIGKLNGPYYFNSVGFLNRGGLLLTPPAALNSGVEGGGRSDDESLTLWDVDTGKVVSHVKGPPLSPGNKSEMPFKYVVSRNGKVVAVLPVSERKISIFSSDGWGVSGQLDLSEKKFGNGPPVDFVFSENSENIFVMQNSGEILLFDFYGKYKRVLDDVNGDGFLFGRPMALSPDGNFLITGATKDGKGFTCVFDIAASKIVKKYNFPPSLVAWNKDGAHIAVSSRNEIRVYDTREVEEKYEFIDVDDAISALQYSPDGRRMAVATGRDILLYYNNLN